MKNINSLNYLVILVLLIFIWLFYNSQLKINELKDSIEYNNTLNNNNISVLFDSIKKLNTGIGTINVKNSFLVNNVEDLKKYNTKLYNDLSKIKGSIAIIDSKISNELPDLKMDNQLITYTDDSTKFGLKFKKEFIDTGLTVHIGGISTFRYNNNMIYPGQTTIDTLNTLIDLKYGFRDTNNKYEVFAYSPSKYIQFNALDGALVLDKPTSTIQKQNKLNWTINAGYYYLPFRKIADFGVGLGLSYTITSFKLR